MEITVTYTWNIVPYLILLHILFLNLYLLLTLKSGQDFLSIQTQCMCKLCIKILSSSFSKSS